MMSKTFLLLAALAVGLYATHGWRPAEAQVQTFLPPMFQLGAKVSLQGDSSKVYTILAQQGAWIRVAVTKTGRRRPTTPRCGSTRRTALSGRERVSVAVVERALDGDLITVVVDRVAAQLDAQKDRTSGLTGEHAALDKEVRNLTVGDCSRLQAGATRRDAPGPRARPAGRRARATGPLDDVRPGEAPAESREARG